MAMGWNSINLMSYIASDLIGHSPEEQPRPNWGPYRGDEWLMRAPGRTAELSRHMRDFGYTVTDHDDGWLGISGSPTNPEAIRDLEIRKAERHLQWLRDPANITDVWITGVF